MAILGHRNSGIRIKNDGTKVNIADLLESIDGNITEISGRDVSSDSISGTVTISSSSATELKVGASALSGRHTLLLNNDSSFSIFFGFDNTVTASTGFFIPSGNILTINLDADTVTQLFAIGGVTDANVTITEIK